MNAIELYCLETIYRGERPNWEALSDKAKEEWAEKAATAQVLDKEIEITDALRTRSHIVACAEISECLKDLLFSMTLPTEEQKKTKVAGCIAGIARALYRLQTWVMR